MKTVLRTKGFAAFLVLPFLAGTGAWAFDRPMVVNSTPAGAAVYINGVRQPSTTPLSLKAQEWKDRNVPITVRVELDRYAPQETRIGYEDARKAKTVTVALDLVEIRREVPVVINANIAGATASVGGTVAGPVPARQTLVFQRSGPTAEWSTVTVQVDKAPHYKKSERVIKADEALAALRASPDGWTIALVMDEIRREIPVDIAANEKGAAVSIDGKPVGQTPLKHTLVFNRPDGVAQWPDLKLEIRKEGFEYRPPEAAPVPAFAKAITVESAIVGKITADFFLPVRFVSAPLRTFEIVADRLVVGRTNLLSEVDPKEQGRQLTQITKAAAESALVLSRISPVRDEGGGDTGLIAFSMPTRELRPATAGGAQAPEEIIGASIWLNSGTTQTRLTHESRNFDTDPFVTADGKWIYFSSDRLRGRTIWRMPASGKGGITKITGDLGTIDTEPAVSPDGGKLAYVARLPGAALTTPPQIWIANADGTLPTQMRAGRSPAWSPDGKKIAFVSPEEKIWIMDADGGNPTQLTFKETREASPIFTPLGKHIIYVSTSEVKDRNQLNFDIWKMTADGSDHTQLTINESFDASPAVSADGKYLYFFSNRGGQKAGEEKLQIYRMELE